MNLSRLAALVLVVVLVTAGAAAAMPGDAPVHPGAEDHEQASDYRSYGAVDANERTDENATDASDDGAANTAAVADGTAQAAGPARARSDDARGPPIDLPAQVPDPVTRIHRLILDFLSGDLDGKLGPSLGDATPDDDGDEAAASSG